MMKPVVRETVIKQIEVSDLDNVVDVQLFGKHPDDDCWDYDWIHDYSNIYWKDNEHIPIAVLEDVVQQLKAQGTTHIQICPHGDHQSYYFTGVKLEVISEKEVKERRRKELETAIENQAENIKTQREKVIDSVDFLGKLHEELEELNDESNR